VSFSLAISNVIDPLRPVSRLLYSPDHVPTRRADEPLSEITGTGYARHETESIGKERKYSPENAYMNQAQAD
jgi:hypothetical protein